MRRPFLIALFLLSSSALAQNLSTDRLPMHGPARFGGVYHVATGTWTRNMPQAVSLGPNITYNNTANSGSFATFGIENQAPGESLEIVHSGRVPSPTTPGISGVLDVHDVNGMDIGYCVGDDSLASGGLSAQIHFYNRYAPCTEPDIFTQFAGTFVVAGLPGADPFNTSLGYSTCWIVQFDMAGGGEICLFGDGDGVYDGDLDFDAFGLGIEFDPGGVGGYVGTTVVGPILAGDRDWTVRAPGELLPASANGSGGGGDTFYGPAEVCLPTGGGLNSTGYDAFDSCWVDYGPSSTTASGCYWFGGYVGNSGCAADSNVPVPSASLYTVLYADTAYCDVGHLDPTVHFCDPADPNSTGVPVNLIGWSISTAPYLHFEARGGPPGEFALMLIGTGADAVSPLPISDGHLCLSVFGGNQFGRYNVAGSALNSIGAFDSTGVLQNLVGTSSLTTGFDIPTAIPIPGYTTIQAGDVWHFQLWYRDTPAGPGHSNLSNAATYYF
ncbi:MAG: hypothetical protein R3F33_09165 [Planctomycetota bacterium]